MKTNRIILFVALPLIIASCYKWDNPYDAQGDNPGTLPEVTTADIRSVTATTATSGGNTTAGGGFNITARGVCWATTQNPTIESNLGITTNGTGTGSWVSELAGLTVSTTYYVRAYATNSAGTKYGNEIVYTQLYIGMSYQGGKIAYILQSGDPGYTAEQTHGLIAAPSDQSTGIQWYNGSNTTTGATATALGTGNANTNTIVTSQGAGSYAAKLCFDLVLGGYSDWYLPSKDELNILYNNKALVGGFAYGNYWSSSEYNNYYALGQDFTTGLQFLTYTDNTYYVRAVRAF